MIISNIGGVITVIANYELTIREIDPEKHSHANEFTLILQALGGTVRDGCFNYAHWLFSFTYLSSAIAMP